MKRDERVRLGVPQGRALLAPSTDASRRLLARGLHSREPHERQTSRREISWKYPGNILEIYGWHFSVIENASNFAFFDGGPN